LKFLAGNGLLHPHYVTIEQKHDMHNMGAVAKIKTATSFLNKRSGTQFHHDWKPMQSIIDILHKISRRTIQIQGDFQDFQEL